MMIVAAIVIVVNAKPVTDLTCGVACGTSDTSFPSLEQPAPPVVLGVELPAGTAEAGHVA